MSNAQLSYPTKYASAAIAEIEHNYHPEYPDADAVILYKLKKTLESGSVRAGDRLFNLLSGDEVRYLRLTWPKLFYIILKINEEVVNDIIDSF